MAVDQGTVYLVMTATIGVIMLLVSIFCKDNKKGKTAQNFEVHLDVFYSCSKHLLPEISRAYGGLNLI